MAKIIKLNCRTCAKVFQPADLVALFAEIEIESKKFPIDAIKDFHTINFKIIKNDGLPQSICYNCLEYFVKFVKFIKQCENSQNILQKQLRNGCCNNYNNYNFNEFEETVNISKFLDRDQNKIEEDKIDFVDTTKLEEYLQFENADNSRSESEETYSTTNDNIDEDFIDKEFKIVESTIKLNDNVMNVMIKKQCNRIILCESCGLEIPKKHFKKHQLSEEHLDIKQYSCDFCDKSYKTYEVLRQHKYRKHKNEKLTKEKHNCIECTKSFYDQNRLNLHIKNIHKNVISKLQMKRKFECEDCKKKFANIGVLERHMVKFHQNSNKSERKHICAECGRTYPRSDHLQLHMRREHLKEKPFQCANCGKRYTAGYQLTYHMKSVHTVKLKENFECDICHKIYSEKYAMNRHKKKYHSQIECTCIICNKIFDNYGKLDRHYTNVHNDELLNEQLLKKDVIKNLKFTIQNDEKLYNCNDPHNYSRNNKLNIEIYETENDIPEIDAAFLDLIDEEIKSETAVELLLKEF